MQHVLTPNRSAACTDTVKKWNCLRSSSQWYDIDTCYIWELTTVYSYVYTRVHLMGHLYICMCICTCLCVTWFVSVCACVNEKKRIRVCMQVAASENTTQITQHDHFFVDSNYARQLNQCQRKRQSRRCKPKRIHVMDLHSDSVYVSWAEYDFDTRILFYWLG